MILYLVLVRSRAARESSRKEENWSWAVYRQGIRTPAQCPGAQATCSRPISFLSFFLSFFLDGLPPRQDYIHTHTYIHAYIHTTSLLPTIPAVSRPAHSLGRGVFHAWGVSYGDTISEIYISSGLEELVVRPVVLYTVIYVYAAKQIYSRVQISKYQFDELCNR